MLLTEFYKTAAPENRAKKRENGTPFSRFRYFLLLLLLKIRHPLLPAQTALTI